MKFGVAGCPNEFYLNYKRSYDMPKFLHDYNLDAFEFQCSRGIRVNEETIEKIKNFCKEYNILLSVHAPYYISLSTQEEDKKEKTINYILDTMRVAKKMGADRIIVHAGSLLGLDREYAVTSACNLLKKAIDEAKKEGLTDVTICPETMGKINQLGSSLEIIKMCKIDDSLIPTIDFGHLYSRSIGKINSYEDWKKLLELYINELGYERMKHFHAHFSKMIYTEKGGEKCHVNFDDNIGGPDYEIICKVLIDLKLEPRIICESAGNQAKDAYTMKQIYLHQKNENL